MCDCKFKCLCAREYWPNSLYSRFNFDSLITAFDICVKTLIKNTTTGICSNLHKPIALPTTPQTVLYADRMFYSVRCLQSRRASFALDFSESARKRQQQKCNKSNKSSFDVNFESIIRVSMSINVPNCAGPDHCKRAQIKSQNQRRLHENYNFVSYL